MFVLNNQHLQIAMSGSISALPEKVFKRLEASWADPFYREVFLRTMKARQPERRLADQPIVSRHQVFLPTPEEMATVPGVAFVHPKMGCKRLTCQMVDQDVVYLRPYEVYCILPQHGLLSRQSASRPKPLTRPPEPDHADEVWHVDLMYVYITPR